MEKLVGVFLGMDQHRSSIMVGAFLKMGAFLCLIEWQENIHLKLFHLARLRIVLGLYLIRIYAG